MKFTTEICYFRKLCSWRWKIKFIDNKDFEYIIKKLPLRELPSHITSEKCSIEGFENTIEGFVGRLETAEASLNKSLDIIKDTIIKYKNEEKQKELETVGQKLWEWDDETNNFKEVKGGC